MLNKIRKAAFILAPLLVLQAFWMFLFCWQLTQESEVISRWYVPSFIDSEALRNAYFLFFGVLNLIVVHSSSLWQRIMDNPAGFLLSCQPLLITVYLWYKKPTWGRAFSMLCAWFFVGLFLVGAVLA